ncbi:MAG TPA: MFS transporter, partial [Lacunisphaera sp.]
MKSPRASLAALLGAQAQVTFTDCAAKFMLIALAQQLAKGQGMDAKPVVSLIATILIAPYVLFGPVCGWLSDRFAKRTVLNVALGLQVALMGLLTGAIAAHSFVASLVCFFLLSVQAAIFAPAKRGILLEYAGSVHLSRYVGFMEMLNVTAILVGTVAGGGLFSHWLSAGGDPWSASCKVALALTGCAVAGWAVFQVAAPTTAQSATKFSAALWVRHFTDASEVWRERPLWRATMGICFFYGIGGYILLLLPQVAFELEHGGVRTGAVASVMAGALGVGTLFGNLFAGLVSRRGVELGLAPLGGLMLAVVLLL